MKYWLAELGPLAEYIALHMAKAPDICPIYVQVWEEVVDAVFPRDPDMILEWASIEPRSLPDILPVTIAAMELEQISIIAHLYIVIWDNSYEEARKPLMEATLVMSDKHGLEAILDDDLQAVWSKGE